MEVDWMASNLKPFLESNDALSDAAELQRRMAQDGYLFFRSLIDPASLLEVRRDLLLLCRQAGWLVEGRELSEGIAKPGQACHEPEARFMEVYNRIMKLESFHALAHYPPMLHLYRRLLAEEVLVHPRNIARLIFPQDEKYTTPAHQDWIHVQGTPETYTSWIPLSDCPFSLGGLVVMAGSHRSGIFKTHSAYGAGGLGIDTERLPFQWVGSEFRLGDVLIFHSHTVHKALPNRDPERLRLSVDYRYQGVSQPIAPGSLQPHHGQITWEEVYQGWKSADYQYYWRKWELKVVPFQHDHPGRREKREVRREK